MNGVIEQTDPAVVDEINRISSAIVTFVISDPKGFNPTFALNGMMRALVSLMVSQQIEPSVVSQYLEAAYNQTKAFQHRAENTH